MERFLAVDLGNSRLKATLFSEGKVTESAIMTADDIDPLLALVDNHGVEAIAMVAVGHVDVRLVETLRNVADGRFILLSSALPMPVDLSVYRKGALGLDRAAALCGTASLFPGRYCVVVDAGTAVTYDAVTPDGQFIGGNIAPGMNMRLEALHRFTARLPRVQVPRELPEGSFLGHDTTSAMILGAVYGIVGSISYYKNHLPSDTRVVMTGGWAGELSRLCDFDVTVDPHLVSKGLNRILIYNENI